MLLFKRQILKVRLSIEGFLTGIVTGIVIAFFRFTIDIAEFYRPIFFEYLKSAQNIFLYALTILILISIAIIVKKLIAFDSQVAGSGIPQIKGIIQNRMTLTNPLRLIAVKLFTSITVISSGMSLGRAGISVQFGACIGSIFNRLLGYHHHHSTIESKYLLIAGAGAGLAAIFNAPLAGVIFCVEELQKKLSPELLMVSITSAVSASVVVEFVFGIRPVFETFTPTFNHFQQLSLSMSAVRFFFCLTVLGVFIGIIGSIFTKSLIFSLNFYDKLNLPFNKFLIPMILILPIGLILPQILGCGNLLVDDLLTRDFNFELLILLLIAKFIFTMICFGTNAPGGIFLPILVLGALSGNIFADVAINLNLFTEAWSPMFIILAMSAYFAASVKAPITGSVLIMELTGNFHHLLALIIVSTIAFLISDICGGKPAYTALLQRSLHL